MSILLLFKTDLKNYEPILQEKKKKTTYGPITAMLLM